MEKAEVLISIEWSGRLLWRGDIWAQTWKALKRYEGRLSQARKTASMRPLRRICLVCWKDRKKSVWLEGNEWSSEGTEQMRPVCAGPVGGGRDCGLYSECDWSQGSVLSQGVLFRDRDFKRLIPGDTYAALPWAPYHLVIHYSFTHRALSSCHRPDPKLGTDVTTESNTHQSLIGGDRSPYGHPWLATG